MKCGSDENHHARQWHPRRSPGSAHVCGIVGAEALTRKVFEVEEMEVLICCWLDFAGGTLLESSSGHD